MLEIELRTPNSAQHECQSDQSTIVCSSIEERKAMILEVKIVETLQRVHHRVLVQPATLDYGSCPEPTETEN